MTNKTISTLFALCLMGLAAPVFAASDEPARATAVDNAKAEADSLLKKGDAAGAYDLYLRLMREAPDDDSLQLGLARAATGAKRWHQAVMAYEALIEKYPREASLYAELANAYMLTDAREAAERSLAVMRALDGKTTETESTLALDELERRYNRFQMHGKVRFGVLYDSNANMGPKSGEMNLGNWRVSIDDARERETGGVYVGADLDLAYRVYQDSPWWIVGDARLFWRGNANSDLDRLHSRESQYGRGAVGLRHLTSNSLLDARLKAEIFDYEFYQNVSSAGPEATFLYAVTPTTQLITRAGVDRRRYSRDRLRDGTYGWAGQYARWFFGAGNHEFLAGARYLGASADRADYGYRGWEASAGFTFKLPKGFELAPNISYAHENYRGPATVLELKDRRDSRLRAGASLTYRVSNAWSLELNYQYARNHSTSPLYDYKQHFVTTGASWSF